MGGCASKPKKFGSSASAPIKSRRSAQSNINGGESPVEKPAVDGSELEKEPKTSSSETVSAETDVATTVKPTEDDVVKAAPAAAENAEDKVEATTKPSVKEGEEAEHKSNDGLPSKEEVKSDDAPLISL